MFLTLIKKINIIINDLNVLIPNSNRYINQKHNDYLDIITNKNDFINILYLSNYIYLINNYIYNITTYDIKYFNKNINDKKYDIINLLKEIINNINNIINIDDVCVYIKNSNINELVNILYLLFILKNNILCIKYAIKLKLNNNNVYLRHLYIYNYDALINNTFKLSNNTGLKPDVITKQQYINDSRCFTDFDKNNINIIQMTQLNGNKYINSFINLFFEEIKLKKKNYNNNGKLIDYGKSNEIKLYNNYVRKISHNKGVIQNTEISVFELFKI